jgi:RNA polymerase sigma-70 factor (ECF subfamily)
MSSLPTTSRSDPSALLTAAGRGDEGAFQQLVEPHRGELHAHCYRMTGSVHDADDALQDAMLRAWRSMGKFKGNSSLRAWLYKIATNTCLDLINRRPKRMLPLDYGPDSDPFEGPGQPLIESVWVEPYPDEQMGLADGLAAPEANYEIRESVELAFIAALQHLPANQRAVLIMREVLGFSAQEAADLLETTPQSVNSALQRARVSVDEKLPEQSQQATLRALGDDEMQKIVENYMDAMQNGDVERVVGMLAEDAAWSMPPLATWYRGDRLPDFLRVGPMSGDWRWKHVPTHANGQLAIGCYTWDDDEGAYLPFCVDVLTLEGPKIKEVTAFIVKAMKDEPDHEDDREYYKRFPDAGQDERRMRSVFDRFGLPRRLD